MKKTLLTIATLGLVVQALTVQVASAHSALASSGSLYKDIECDMSSYTCYKLVMDLGRQDAIAYIMNGGAGEKSNVLQQAIKYVKENGGIVEGWSDEEIIAVIAGE